VAEEPGPPPRRSGLDVLEDGVVAGILGAAVIAVWFVLIDAARGQLLHTPTLLGSVLFLGKSVEEVTSVNLPIVFAYTGLHGLGFLAAGTALSWMVGQFERNPQFGLVLLLLFLLFESILFGFEVTVFPVLVGALGTLAVASANLLAAVVMFWFLLRRRPGVLQQLRDGWRE
jgi:hypothetical protein